MKIRKEYPNYVKGLMYMIEDKNPVLASNDSKILSYFIPLYEVKNGFDYYELTRTWNGGVYFSVVTMKGLKTIVRTDAEFRMNDISKSEWINEIYDITISHFLKEEYIALKKGYTRQNNSGCFSSVLVLIVTLSIIYSIY